MDFALENHQSYIGSHTRELPTPAFVIRKSTIEQNIARLHKDVENAGIAFRPHVKTLKTIEVTRMMLSAKSRGIVASTIAEIRGVLPLVDEGLLDNIVYGLPINRSALKQLVFLRSKVKIILIVDHEQHIQLLESLNGDFTWDVFIKIDVGTRRAGVPTDSQRLPELINRVEKSSAVSLFGFYCHAGHSYSCTTIDSAQSVLEQEVHGVSHAASLMPSDRRLVISVGSTPTAHVIQNLKASVGPNITLELHAGNFPTNDLQQVSTGLVTEAQQAIRVIAEVCSVYPERNEALINAGAIALSKETCNGYKGFGTVVGKPGWFVTRMSQEHGILACSQDSPLASDEFHVGDIVQLYCVHSCITAAAFHAYFVVDDDDIVRETWVPWKGW